MISKNTEEELSKNLPYQIDYTANFNKSFRREFHAKIVCSEVTADEFAILYLITHEPNISQSEIAQFLFKGKAHVGKILNEMEARGLIIRKPTAADNIIIKKNIITDKGKIILEKGNKEALKIRDKMLQEFSNEEIDQFITYLKKFRNVLNSIIDVKLK